MKKRKELFKKLSLHCNYGTSYLKIRSFFLYIYIFKEGDDHKLNICIKINIENHTCSIYSWDFRTGNDGIMST